MNFPEGLRYSKEHEWVRVSGDHVFVGVTDFAQRELGDIVYLEVETQGETLDADAVFGSIEAVKTVSDLFMPISGSVLEVNSVLMKNPQEINSQAYESWIIKLKPNDMSQVDSLMTSIEYKDYIGV